VAVSVDVEDYFQVSAFRNSVRYEDWDGMPSRIERNTSKVLDLLSEFGIQGTFFVLGWVAERYPHIVREILEQGHELGCHSYAHRLIYDMTPDEFRADTERALRALEDASGTSIQAYRAPSFSITPRSKWAFDILLDLGIRLDSSLFPIRHDLYGFPGIPRNPFKICLQKGELAEFPMPTVTAGHWTLPVTGGGYLRLLPLRYQIHALQSRQANCEPSVLYFHPWELDPEQDRIETSLRSRLRHYTGLHQTEARLRILFGKFNFTTMTEVMKTAGPMGEYPCSPNGN
jgi:polysaccharide deacetylase family protein (PEP-CTERM system associated)